MRKPIITICFIFLFLHCAFAQQTYPTPTAEETKEAQELAAKFYNRLTETQDIKPLIKEFFISDFNKRVNYCFKTGLCGGYNRDFWSGFGEGFAKTKYKIDFQRFYINWLNYFYLFMRVFIYVSPESLDIPNNVSEDLQKENAKKALKSFLKNKPYLLKKALQLFQFDSKKGLYEDLFPEDFKTIRKFSQYQKNLERNIAILKPIEANLRIQKQKRDSTLNFTFSPKDFRIDIEEGTSFFNYPTGTKFIEIWDDIWDDKTKSHKYIPFKMDLVKENGKLKIVAVYPPMD